MSVDPLRELVEHRVGLYVLAAEKLGMTSTDAMAVLADRDPYLARAVAAIEAPDATIDEGCGPGRAKGYHPATPDEAREPTLDAAWEALWDKHEDTADYCGFNRATFNVHRTAIEAAIRADTLRARTEAPPASDEVARLRRQNHEYAERRDRDMAALQSQVDRYRNAYEQARELVRGSPVDWSKDAASQKPDGWWNYTSQNNRDILAAAVLAATDAPSGGELDAAWAEVEAAMSDGWHWEDITRLTGDSEGEWSACARNDTGEGRYRWCGTGSTPAAALLALAARLRATPDRQP